MNKSFAVFQSSFCHSKSLIHNHDGCQKGSVYCYQVRNLCMSKTLQPGGPLMSFNICLYIQVLCFSFSCHLQYINVSLNKIEFYIFCCFFVISVEKVGLEKLKLLNWFYATWRLYITNAMSFSKWVFCLFCRRYCVQSIMLIILLFFHLFCFSTIRSR